jgi:hypothetical protein
LFNLKNNPKTVAGNEKRTASYISTGFRNETPAKPNETNKLSPSTLFPPSPGAVRTGSVSIPANNTSSNQLKTNLNDKRLLVKVLKANNLISMSCLNYDL